MARDPLKFKLGVFVLSGLVLLVAGILAIGAGEWYRESVPVFCYFEENVSGLDQGSPVRYRGVTIGVVREVKLVQRSVGSMRPDAPIQVTCVIYPDQIGSVRSLWSMGDDAANQIEVSVSGGLRASLGVKDITLQKYIALEHFPLAEQPIPILGFEPRRPWIPTAQEATFQDMQRDLASTLAQLARVNYEDISVRILDLLDVTTQRIEAIDTQALAGHAEETLVAVRRLAEDPALRRVIDRLDSVALHADSAMTRIDEMVQRGQFDEVATNLAEASRSLAATSKRLESDIPRLLEGVDDLVATAERTVEGSRVPETAESLRGAADAVGGAARNLSAMREDLRRTLRDFSQASRSVGRLARYLEENPESVLSGRPSGEEE